MAVNNENRFLSLNSTLLVASLAFLTGIARLILEVRFVPEITNALPANQPGQAALVILPIVVFFGIWLWALLAAARNRRTGLIAALGFSLLLALGWGLPTALVFCPTPCATAAPLTDIVTRSNVIVGLLAAITIIFYVRSNRRLRIDEDKRSHLPMPISTRPVRWIALFTALSWLGEYIHNRFDLPALTMLSPENSLPALLSVVLFLFWWRFPSRRSGAVTLLGWGATQLVGGILSVIPFRFLPFYPPQMVQHYLMHTLYAAAQLPLLIALIRELLVNNPSNRVAGAKT